MRKLKIKKHTHDLGASLLSQQSPKSFELVIIIYLLLFMTFILFIYLQT